MSTTPAAEPVAPASAADAISCANCGAPLAGRYCSACGQRHHDQPVHHFWHFIGEAFEDLTHADSRLWQTLIALLFRPGFLTREFLEGRRVRYLPPVRLYLVVSVIFFIIAGLHSRLSGPQAIVLTENGKALHYQVVAAGQVAGSGATARQRLCEQSGTFLRQHGGWLAWLGPRVTQNCMMAVSAGGLERLSEAVTHNLERAMFLFLPLLALVMKPLYVRPPRHYIEHLLFFLHNHAFLFVVLAASATLKMITSSGPMPRILDAAIAIYIPIYFYRAMRRVYGQGGWLTLSKLTVLAVAYFFLGILMLLATFSYSFLML